MSMAMLVVTVWIGLRRRDGYQDLLSVCAFGNGVPGSEESAFAGFLNSRQDVLGGI
jgi:hypothetical protein